MIKQIIKETNDYVKSVTQQQHAPLNNWRSSSLGSCMRGRLLSRLFAGEVLPDYDDTTLGIFQMGHITEESIIKTLRKNKDYVIFTQGEMYSIDYVLKGHFDALLIHKATGKSILIEVKSRNSNAFKFATKEASLHYKMQAHSYLYMINTIGFSIECDVSNLGTKINTVKYMLQNAYGDEKATLENTLEVLQSQKEAIDYILTQSKTNKNYAFMSLHNAFRLNIKTETEKAYVLYVNKDTYEHLEFEVNYDDKELTEAWQFEMDTLNYCWRTKQAPVKTDPTAWQSKYCQFCKAGLCQQLDNKMYTKALFDIYEKRTGIIVI